jgi:hypothetical protein
MQALLSEQLIQAVKEKDDIKTTIAKWTSEFTKANNGKVPTAADRPDSLVAQFKKVHRLFKLPLDYNFLEILFCCCCYHRYRRQLPNWNH